MKYKDYYASLGLERGASDEQIKKAQSFQEAYAKWFAEAGI